MDGELLCWLLSLFWWFEVAFLVVWVWLLNWLSLLLGVSLLLAFLWGSLVLLDLLINLLWSWVWGFWFLCWSSSRWRWDIGALWSLLASPVRGGVDHLVDFDPHIWSNLAVGNVFSVVVLLKLNSGELKSAVSIDHSLTLFASVFDFSGILSWLLSKILDDNFISASADLDFFVEILMTLHTIGEVVDANWGVVMMSVGIGGSQEHGDSKRSFKHIFLLYNKLIKIILNWI